MNEPKVLSSDSRVKPRAPLPIIIISWLTLFTGLFNSLGALMAVYLQITRSNLMALTETGTGLSSTSANNGT